MTKQQQLKALYNQYLETVGFDLLFESFFDVKNKSNLDRKINTLEKAIAKEVSFLSINEEYDLLDNYPQDIEDEGGHWTALPE